MKKGDIVWAKDTKQHFHPIVFLDRIDDSSFKACILSSKPTGSNLLMQSSHFCDNDNNLYSFQYRNTHLVIKYIFIKKDNWIEPNIVGRLTDEGIEFVENNIHNQELFHDAPVWELKH